MFKFLARLHERFFGFSDNLLPVEKTTQIQCTPTFWKFVNDKNQLLDWDVSETIQLVDNKKISKLLSAHLSSKYPDENKLKIAIRTTWTEREQIIKHIISDHFEEVKQEAPKNQVSGRADSRETVVGLKNILTDENIVFSVPRCLIEEDEIIYFIRTIDWNVINKISKKEPA